MKLGVVTGLHREVQCLSPYLESKNVIVKVSGANSDRAEEQATALITEGCGILLSFGIAGAINPKLASGDLVIANKVISRDEGLFHPSEVWIEKLEKTLANCHSVYIGSIAGFDSVIQTPIQKTKVFRETSALAVDMESHRIAKVALEKGIPFLATRAILDSANMEIPESVINVINFDGNPNYRSIILNFLQKPGDLSKTVRLSKSFGKALATLTKVSAVLASMFSLV